MARLARVMIPGIPYHVTHRGNRRGDVFFEEADRNEYLAHWARAAARFGVRIWGWCLMSQRLGHGPRPRGHNQMCNQM
jgi:putative transposase